VEEGHGSLIDPLEVVHDKQKRPKCGEGAVRGLEDPERVASRGSMTAEHEAIERHSVTGDRRQPAEQLTNRREGDRPRRLESREAHPSASISLRQDLGEDAGLAGPGLAGD
jgi:hypothetical protein